VCVCLSMSSFRCAPAFPPMVRLIPCELCVFIFVISSSIKRLLELVEPSFMNYWIHFSVCSLIVVDVKFQHTGLLRLAFKRMYLIQFVSCVCEPSFPPGVIHSEVNVHHDYNALISTVCYINIDQNCPHLLILMEYLIIGIYCIITYYYFVSRTSV
jgi:hypothetical protein